MMAQTNSNYASIQKLNNQPDLIKSEIPPLVSVISTSSLQKLNTVQKIHHPSNLIYTSTSSFLQMIIVPWSLRHHPDPPLLRSVHKSVSAARMKPGNIDVVVRARQRAHVLHPPGDVVQACDRMPFLLVIMHAWYVLTYAVPQQAVLGCGRELDARDARRLGAIEGRGHEELSKVWMTSHGFGTDNPGMERQGLAVGRGGCVERHSHDMGDIPPTAPLMLVGGMVRVDDRERMGRVPSLAPWHVGNVAFARGRGGFQ
mmetsp:Transcript_34502/g.83503  ORF Transcript_34502/g.83503 Transcript_34502/m.83503 type:complete len:257 (+) Transcript_34502:26-796(+)